MKKSRTRNGQVAVLDNTKLAEVCGGTETTTTTVSNVLKKYSDTSSGIVANMK